MQRLEMEVRGRHLATGLPVNLVVNSDDMLEALKEPAAQVVEAVLSVLERTPPELSADISDRGWMFSSWTRQATSRKNWN